MMLAQPHNDKGFPLLSLIDYNNPEYSWLVATPVVNVVTLSFSLHFQICVNNS